MKKYRNFPDFNTCNRHPYSSDVGICPYCLTEKLKKLVCSECGKSRVSSCSCSDNRNSCSRFDDVGRISFFIGNENENENRHSKSKRKGEKVVLFRRSSSSCVEDKKKNGFWRIKGLFGKKTNKTGDDEVCVSDINGVSRSVSFSNAKISDVFYDSSKCFSSNQILEIDRVCSFPNGSVFPIKGSDDFSHMINDDSEFIDLKLDSLSESNQDFFSSGGISHHPNIGGNPASLKSKWGLWKKGFFQGSKA